MTTTDLGNIHFFIDENEYQKKDETNETDEENNQTILDFYSQLEYNFIQNLVVPHELLATHTLKDLQKIAAYYGLSVAKYKKQDIIDMIVQFENLPENTSIVQQRKKMWAYMSALLEDPKMKQLRLVLIF